MDDLDAMIKGRAPVCLVTLVDREGSAPQALGARMLVTEKGETRGTIGGGSLEWAAIQESMDCLSLGEPRRVSWTLGSDMGQCCGGRVTLFFEPVNCEPHLIIFGAGHVGQALASIMSATRFSVRMWDLRQGWFDRLDLPANVVTSQVPVESITDLCPTPTRSFCAVMTHRHDLDQLIIEQLLPHNLSFLGLIGSKTKAAKFSSRLRAKGFSNDQTLKIHCPIGSGRLGNNPMEVAVSIAAQLLATSIVEVPASPICLAEDRAKCPDR